MGQTIHRTAHLCTYQYLHDLCCWGGRIYRIILFLWCGTGKYVLETGHMSGSNSFVFSAKRRGSNTPVVCKFFSDQESFRREMKFFERVHTGDFVPGGVLPPRPYVPHECPSCSCSIDLRWQGPFHKELWLCMKTVRWLTTLSATRLFLRTATAPYGRVPYL